MQKASTEVEETERTQTTGTDNSDLDKSSSASSTSSDSEGALPSQYKIPKFKYYRTQEELKKLRMDFPNLAHHPDATFHSNSLKELISLNVMLGGGGKATKKLTEKLARNLERTKQNPKEIRAGQDNRADMLHEARFLPGPTCKHTELWLKARRSVGLSGVDPVSKYDTEGMGLGGKINSTIWALLHNPGSKELSIEMLAPAALEAARGYTEKEAAHPKKHFENFHDLRMALATLRVASRMALPWNFAIETLDFFLNSVQFGEPEFGQRQNKFLFLAEFIDQVLHMNAEAWDDEKNYMTHSDLRGKWYGDVQEKYPRGGGGGGPSQRFDNRSRQTKGPTPSPTKGTPADSSSGGGSSRTTPYKGPYIPDHLCRRYQYKRCPKQEEKECTPPWGQGTLAHLCGHYLRDEKKYCEQAHPLLDHK